MSDNKTSAPEAPAQPAAPQLAINAQYVKDFSFENPNAPQSLTNNAGTPQIAVNVEVQARPAGENLFEVALKLSANAKRGEAQAFVVELVYAGLFTMRNIPREHLEMVCLIECPRLLFPFARRIVADATRDGGYPPLMLDPIDFVALYQQNRAQQQQVAGPAAGTA